MGRREGGRMGGREVTTKRHKNDYFASDHHGRERDGEQWGGLRKRGRRGGNERKRKWGRE